MSNDTPLRAEFDALVHDLKVLRDEIRVQLHLASREAATRWKEDLEPKLGEIEQRATEAGQQAAEAASHLAKDLKQSFVEFRDRLR